jgi:glycosyltransferase involved in cell wall biosynthesis
MQAAAMGLPSIVTDINGCNEIISGGVNGLLVTPKDVNALTSAMEFLLQDPAEVDRMAKNARPLITSRYEQQVVWEAILEEYRGLMGR